MHRFIPDGSLDGFDAYPDKTLIPKDIGYLCSSRDVPRTQDSRRTKSGTKEGSGDLGIADVNQSASVQRLVVVR